MHKFTFFILTGVLLLFSAKTVFADTTTCTPIYGGGQNCVTTGNIAISKAVKNPKTGGFVANLGINDPKYSKGQTVTFEVTVTNNDSNANTITVTDNLPQYFKFISGPGTFNSSNNVLIWTVTGLEVGKAQTFIISGKITNSIPTNGNVCAVNQVSASSNNGDYASANSQFCLQNTPLVLKPAKVTVTPPTGPEALPLFSLIPGALVGFGLIRKSKIS